MSSLQGRHTDEERERRSRKSEDDRISARRSRDGLARSSLPLVLSSLLRIILLLFFFIALIVHARISKTICDGRAGVQPSRDGRFARKLRHRRSVWTRTIPSDFAIMTCLALVLSRSRRAQKSSRRAATRFTRDSFPKTRHRVRRPSALAATAHRARVCAGVPFQLPGCYARGAEATGGEGFSYRVGDC
jgi:hypothetical protein